MPKYSTGWELLGVKYRDWKKELVFKVDSMQWKYRCVSGECGNVSPGMSKYSLGNGIL